ncbi:hypothetical protein KBB12_02030 [Candidatus Woesebacteria bacterium]|nr:hypothetical protein [Candidatus Woesebacteria bacterium]
MERFNPRDVKIVVTTHGRGDLRQQLSFPDGTMKEGQVAFRDLCEEGDELLSDLSRRPNPVYQGTQGGWHRYVNGLLASRGQHIDFSK